MIASPSQLFKSPEVRSQANQAVQRHLQKTSPIEPGQGVNNFEQTRLSDELMQEAGRQFEAGGVPDLDALMSTLGGKDQANEPAKGNESDPKGKPKVERIEVWNPTTFAGEITGAHDKIGEMTVKERVTQPEDSGQGKGAAAVGGVKGRGTVGGVKQASPGAMGPQANKNQENDNKTTNGPEDKVNLSSEGKQASQQLQSKGFSLGGGLNPNASTQPKSPEAKPGAQAPGQVSERIVEQGDIHTRCGGMAQSVKVQEAGELGPDSFLRMYQKLDDAPDQANVTFHKKDGKKVVEEEDDKILRGEKVKPMDPELRKKLLNPIASHQ